MKAESPEPNETLRNVDWVPPSLPKWYGKAKLLILEDNDAVIKMTIKGRSPALRHVPRTHRIDLDWLFERIREDPGVAMRYVNTKFQIADLLTKGSFSSWQWKALCELAQVVPPSNSVAEAVPAQSARGDPGGDSEKTKKAEKTRLEKRREWYKKKKRSNTNGSANLFVNVPNFICCAPHITSLNDLPSKPFGLQVPAKRGPLPLSTPARGPEETPAAPPAGLEETLA